MSRLFVAFDLPTPVKAALVAIQPAEVAGLRLVASSRMHLTLHFLGNEDIVRTTGALKRIAAPAVPLAIHGVGRFTGRTTTLWAGVNPAGELLELHEQIADRLREEGFRPEARPYHPHVTLARCDARVPASVVRAFLTLHADFALPEFTATAFHLYSSDLGAAAPIYRRESTFELAGPG